MTSTDGIGAVVLSLGEPFVERARASIAAQSVPIAPIVTVEHVSPFSRALNTGAAHMPTPWFVQVDADMILDANCVETLRSYVRPDTGIVVAELRDVLSERVVGVKLFRTACFREEQVGDSVGQDTDFVARLGRRGWKTVYVEEPAPGGGTVRPALGEHRPDYTPEYTFRKLLVEGRKLRHRNARHGLYFRFGMFETSTHPLALLSELALGHGFFLCSNRDELRPVAPDPRAAQLVALLSRSDEIPELEPSLLPIERYDQLSAVFRDCLAAGESIARRHAGGTLRRLMSALTPVERDPRRLVAKIALGHGVLMDDDDRARLASDTAALRRFVLFSLGSSSSWWEHLRARGGHVLRARHRVPSYVPW